MGPVVADMSETLRVPSHLLPAGRPPLSVRGSAHVSAACASSGRAVMRTVPVSVILERPWIASMGTECVTCGRSDAHRVVRIGVVLSVGCAVSKSAEECRR